MSRSSPFHRRAAAIVLSIIVLLSVRPGISSAEWMQEEFVIGSWVDPCFDADYRLDPTAWDTDSLRLVYYRGLGFNFLTATGIGTSNSGSYYGKTLEHRTRLCQHLGIRTLTRYQRPGAACCYKRASVSFPSTWPACANCPEYGPFPFPSAYDCRTSYEYEAALPATSTDGFAGYYLDDEPAAGAQTETAKDMIETVHANSPTALGYVNWLPGNANNHAAFSAYLDAALLDPDPARRPDVVSFDLYPFGRLTTEGFHPDYYYNLRQFRARTLGRPLWAFIQSVRIATVDTYPTCAYGGPTPTETSMRFEIANALAYGAKGIVYFTYRLQPRPDGTPTCFQDAIISSCDDFTDDTKTIAVRRLNHHLREVSGPLVMSSDHLATYHESSQPTGESVPSEELLSSQDGLVEDLPGQGCAVGVFTDSNDPTTVYLLVVNKSYENSASGQVRLRGFHTGLVHVSPSVVNYAGGMSWSSQSTTYVGGTTRFSVTLAPGEGRFFRVTDVDPSFLPNLVAGDPLELAVAPSPIESDTEPAEILRVHPSPTRGDAWIRLSVPKATHGTTAIYNVRGERVRLLADGAIAAGAHQLTWDGKTDDGRSLSRGVYFVRLRTADGLDATRTLVLTEAR